MSRSLLISIVVLLSACGTSSSSSSATGGLNAHDDPLEGTWTGDQINFELADGQITVWFVQDVQCSAINENVNAPEQCVEEAKGLPDVSVAIEHGSFVVELGELAIAGTFDAAGHVSGSWTFRPEKCCTSSGNWEAWHHTWAETKGDPNPPDAGSTSGVDSLDGTDNTDSVDGIEGTDGEDGTDRLDRTDTSMPEPGTDYLVPSDAGPSQLEAINRVNWYRKNTGAPLMNMNAASNAACVAHANYWTLHEKAYQSGKIAGGAHYESSDYSEGFTGKDFGDRMKSAGYSGAPGYEVIAFMDNATAAVDGWVETVYHRIPILSPDAIDGGYGASPTIDVMDFGRKGWPQMDTFILYPWPNQTDVPRSWGGYESPQPPVPPTGYPSGPVITVIVPSGSPLEIDTHQLLGPKGKAIDHVWHPRNSNNFMDATWAMYSNDPLAGNTSYTVILEGSYQSSPWKREWSFTTRK